MLDKDRIRWLVERGARISISFDVLPEVQNRQRLLANGGASFELVDRALRGLGDAGISTGIRVTVSPLNLNRLVDTVEFAADRYPHVRYLRLEPEVNPTVDLARVYERFIPEFMNARKMGRARGVAVNCAFSKNLPRKKAHFCRGELCLTPAGDIVACHRITSPVDARFESVRYGSISETQAVVDGIAFDNLVGSHGADEQCCAGCFARWHCAGNCRVVWADRTESQMAELCKQVRVFYTALLAERLTANE